MLTFICKAGRAVSAGASTLLCSSLVRHTQAGTMQGVGVGGVQTQPPATVCE